MGGFKPTTSPTSKLSISVSQARRSQIQSDKNLNDIAKLLIDEKMVIKEEEEPSQIINLSLKSARMSVDTPRSSRAEVSFSENKAM